MNTQQLVEKLRELADRIEAANIPAGVARPEIEIKCFGPIKSREELAGWVRLMHNPQPYDAGNSHWISGDEDRAEITVWYEPGLLGERIKERVVERTREATHDIAGLLAEFPPAATPAESGVAV